MSHRITASVKESMLTYRNNGYSNAEIARLTGYTSPSVIHAIGKQPKEITAISKRAVKVRVTMRHAYQARTQLLTQQNTLLAQRAETTKQLLSIKRRIRTLDILCAVPPQPPTPAAPAALVS